MIVCSQLFNKKGLFLIGTLSFATILRIVSQRVRSEGMVDDAHLQAIDHKLRTRVIIVFGQGEAFTTFYLPAFADGYVSPLSSWFGMNFAIYSLSTHTIYG